MYCVFFFLSLNDAQVDISCPRDETISSFFEPFSIRLFCVGVDQDLK